MKCVAVLALLALAVVCVSADTCKIDGTTSIQEIDGFGFSSAWCGTLNSNKVVSLFDTLGMSILRIRIDENEGWSDETNNAKAAHSYGAKVLGSPWSPPPSWKQNGYLMPSHYEDYAHYLNNASAAIGFDWVSIQNEPDYGTTWTGWTVDEMYTWMKNYSSLLNLPIVFPESYHFNDSFSDPVLNDPALVGNLAIVGGHLYGGGNYVHTNAIAKGKHVWMTEHYLDNANDMATVVQIAEEVMDCMNNQFSAYIWWWVPDSDSSDITLLAKNGTIFKNGYTLGQWSKFVKAGAVHISATYKPTTNVLVTAFYDEKLGLTVVAANTGSTQVSQDFTVAGIDGLTTLLVHRTSKSEGLTPVESVTVADNEFSYDLPAQSITTFHEN